MHELFLNIMCIIRNTILILLLASCIDLSLDKQSDCYTIDKGKHYSKRSIDNSYSQVKFEADLNNALYDTVSLGIDKYDWNKLYGISSSKIHENSYRIGFRLLNGKWEFSAYWYKDGQRNYKYLGSCDINDKPIFNIDARNDDKCLFEMVGENSILADINKPKHFFRSYPYFGGNRKAPNKIEICIKEL